MHDEPMVISLKELFSTLIENIRLLLLFTLTFFVIGVIYLSCKPAYYQSTALIQTNNQSYAFNSIPALFSAVTTFSLDIQVTPWHFPIIGNALANHYDQKIKNLADGPAKPLWGLDRYSWGGDQVKVTLFEIPNILTNEKLTLIYLGNGHYQLWQNHEMILAGSVGTLVTAKKQFGQIKLLISEIQANPNTHFYIKKLSLTDAANHLKSNISLQPPEFQENSTIIMLKGRANDHLQETLSAIINNGIALIVHLRLQQSQSMLIYLENQLSHIQDNIQKIDMKINQSSVNQRDELEKMKRVQAILYANTLLDIDKYNLKKASSLSNPILLSAPTPLYSAPRLSNWILVILIALAGLFLGIVFVLARKYLK